MIEISLKVDENHICHTNYNVEGYTTLNDVALILLEWEKIKQTLMEESNNYKPIMEMKNNEYEKTD